MHPLYIEDKVFIANHLIESHQISSFINQMKRLIDIIIKNSDEKLRIKLTTYMVQLNDKIEKYLLRNELSVCFLAKHGEFIKNNCSPKVVNLYLKKFDDIVKSTSLKDKDPKTHQEEMEIFAKKETEYTIEFFEEYTGTDSSVLKIKKILDNLQLLSYKSYIKNEKI